MLSRRALIGTAAGAGLGLVTGVAQGETVPDTDLLRIARRKGIWLGTAIGARDVADEQVVRLYRRHCNSYTPRNSLKWQAVEQRKAMLQWGEADRLVSFAQAAKAACYGHTLIWHRVPAWVAAIRSAGELRAAMRERIQGTMGRYVGRIHAWDVVNEALEYEKAELRSSLFQSLLGNAYIEESFALAREADPRATLVLNETHLEKRSPIFSQRRTLFLKLLEQLLARGTPVQAVGLQGHFRPGLDLLDEEELSRFCAALKAMGLAIYITELDGSCRFASKIRNRGERIYDYAFQRFVEVVGASGALHGITLWGMAERYVDREARAPQGCATAIGLFDQQLRPRHTLDAFARALTTLPDARSRGDS